jgi:transcriptional regulator with XRE-family HTH domain
VQKFNGHLLRAIRKDRNLRPEQLAVLIGRSYQAVNLYECGHRLPPVSVLERLAAVLDTDVANFFDDDPVAA